MCGWWYSLLVLVLILLHWTAPSDQQSLVLHRYQSIYQQNGPVSYPPLLTDTESDPVFSRSNAEVGLDVVYINLPHSHQRRHYLHETLHFYGFTNDQITRISAFSQEEVIIPPQVADVALCNHLSRADFNDLVASTSSNRSSASSTNSTRYVFLEALCGRKKNYPRELTVTMSHLLALHQILYARNDNSSSAQRPYALVLEDDMHLFMEVNFSALIASAPSDFAVLQLVTSNDYSVSNLWKVYLRHKLLWVKRKDKDDYWCAGAYLVRKSVLKPILYRIFSYLQASLQDSAETYAEKYRQHQQQEQKSSPSQSFRANVVAAYASPCYPKDCCNDHGHLSAISDLPLPSIFNTSTLQNKATGLTNFFRKNEISSSSQENSVFPQCVRSPRGFQSDAFVFTLAPSQTYMLTLPMFTNSETGNVSTVHQRHVQWHQAAFRRGRKILALGLSGKLGIKLPGFFNTQCRLGLGLLAESLLEGDSSSSSSSSSRFAVYEQEKRQQEQWTQDVLAHRHSALDT